MDKLQKNNTKWDLEERTTEFAKQVIRLCRKISKDCVNSRLISQVVGSSGSIGANYREANDSLGKKDFQNRIKISRKEAKETIHWLQLIAEANGQHNSEIEKLIQECTEIRNILSSILNKSL